MFPLIRTVFDRDYRTPRSSVRACKKPKWSARSLRRTLGSDVELRIEPPPIPQCTETKKETLRASRTSSQDPLTRPRGHRHVLKALELVLSLQGAHEREETRTQHSGREKKNSWESNLDSSPPPPPPQKGLYAGQLGHEVWALEQSCRVRCAADAGATDVPEIQSLANHRPVVDLGNLGHFQQRRRGPVQCFLVTQA